MAVAGVSMGAFTWRRPVHRACTGAVMLLSVVHLSMALTSATDWTPDSVWSVATGLGLLYLAVINWAHVGEEPCTQPTAKVVRWGNWAWAVVGVAAVAAVPELQVYVLATALAGQAFAGHVTLRRSI